MGSKSNYETVKSFWNIQEGEETKKIKKKACLPVNVIKLRIFHSVSFWFLATLCFLLDRFLEVFLS